MTTIFRAILGYWFLLLVVRNIGRRPGAQLTPFEFVLIFIIGGIIIQSVVGDDRSMTNALCTVITVGLMHRMVSKMKQRYPKFGAIVDGTPLVLMENGRWCTEVMDKMRIQDTDVMAAGRTRGIQNLAEIKYAILERNGSISTIKKTDEDQKA
jgi:uncharacterized membrane protein YcaP (DUF421 family)